MKNYIKLLLAFDDGINDEFPKGFDHKRSTEKVLKIQSILQEELNLAFAFEGNQDIQDASFFAELKSLPGNPMGSMISITFSCFGDFVQIHEEDCDTCLYEQIDNILTKNGYVIIPKELLNTAYNGKFSYIKGTWADRYFNYL